MLAMKNDWCVAIPMESVAETEQPDFLEDMGLKLHHSSIDDILMGDIDNDPWLEGLDK